MVNSYRPPATLPVQPYHLDTPAAEYDGFSMLPIPAELKSNGLILTLAIPSVHARTLYEQVTDPVYDYLPYGPFSTFDAYLTWFEGLRRDATVLLFVILDQSLVFDHPLATPELESHRTERIAGSIALLKTDHVNRETEIGHVKIHSRFQRTHVLTHAAGLILKWLFDEVGYRRVSWFANHLNRPSVEAALRLGYFEEGTLRWNRVLAAGKLGQPLPPAMAEREAAAGRGTVGRHSVVLAIGFDDWNDGRDGAEPISVRMSRLMDREVVKKAAV